MLVSAYRRFRGAEAVGCGVGLGPGGVRAHATATHPNKCEISVMTRCQVTKRTDCGTRATTERRDLHLGIRRRMMHMRRAWLHCWPAMRHLSLISARASSLAQGAGPLKAHSSVSQLDTLSARISLESRLCLAWQPLSTQRFSIPLAVSRLYLACASLGSLSVLSAS